MNWTCKFCKKEKYLKNKFTKSGHLAKCTKFKEYKNNVFTKEFFEIEYIQKARSALEIAQEHGLESASAIIKQMKLLNIPTRSIKESKNDREKNKRKQTNLKKYGIEHNFCKDHPSRIKWKKEMFEREGIINIFQKQEIIDKMKPKTMNTKYRKGLAIPPENQNDWTEYKRKTTNYTKKIYRRYKDKINPDNKIRGFQTYHVDHIISKQYGFRHNIPVTIICHPANLHIITSTENQSKGLKCTITINELMKRIQQYDNTKNYQNI